MIELITQTFQLNPPLPKSSTTTPPPELNNKEGGTKAPLETSPNNRADAPAEEVKLLKTSLIGPPADTLGLKKETLKEVLEMLVSEIKAAQMKTHEVDTKLVSKFMVFEK